MNLKLVIAVSLLLVTSSCFAGIEVSGGTIHYQQTPNGTWYQIGLPHDFNPPPHVWSIGYTDYFKPNTRYHAGFVSLGGVVNNSVDVSDGSFSSSGMNGCSVNCGNKWRFNGSSKLTALYVTLAPEWDVQGGKVFVEYGGALYHLTFWEQSAKISGSNVGTTAEYRFSGLRPGLVLGIGAQYGNWQAALISYVNRFTSVGVAPPNFSYIVTTAQIRYLF
jgi:hypothetical protein